MAAIRLDLVHIYIGDVFVAFRYGGQHPEGRGILGIRLLHLHVVVYLLGVKAGRRDVRQAVGDF
jgi:hypothetical protein